jgi:hypothetical protein
LVAKEKKVTVVVAKEKKKGDRSFLGYGFTESGQPDAGESNRVAKLVMKLFTVYPCWWRNSSCKSGGTMVFHEPNNRENAK